MTQHQAQALIEQRKRTEAIEREQEKTRERTQTIERRR